MTHQEIRKRFLDFFESRGHKIVPSSSLLPGDPSVLFTTAGMQQFKPYFIGLADPMMDLGSRRAVSIQKSMRTSDIDAVGDESHLTFFEMLGHFSFGDYFKKETIEWTYEFLTEELKISKNRISATVFSGDDKIPFDEESYDVWSRLLPQEKIKKGSRGDNVWGPAGPEGPCGAANEVYVDGLEAATLVFMEYSCGKDGKLTPLMQKGVDVGWGLERIAMISQGKNNIFETDLLQPIAALASSESDVRTRRIIADHSRSTVFLIADGVRPSNKEQGYVLRRLMRRIIAHNFLSESDITLMHDIFAKITEIYGRYYPGLNTGAVIYEFDREKEKFEKTLKQGLKELQKFDRVDSENAFKLYESFGLPFEIIKDIGGEKSERLIRENFDEEFKKHQEKSRAGAEKKFGGHGLLLDTGELKAGDEEELGKATRLHTATHLLHAALRKILGNEVKQSGSDITAKRLRFDFTFPRKLTTEEIEKTENLINEAIEKDYKVTKEEMSYEDAVKSGALAFFKLKYPEKVSVYSIGLTNNLLSGSGELFSRELCGGPHVSHTAEVGRIRITKEETVGAGVRRIRAIVG